MNSVVLIGRLTRDPELNYTQNTRTAVCKFTLAVDRPRRQGEENTADFLRITVFGRQAENCDRYLARGRQAAVHGRIETGSYTNRDGVKVNTTDIIADNVEFLGGSSGERPQSTREQAEEYRPTEQQAEEFVSNVKQMVESWDLPDSFSASEDDIPF